MSTEKSSDIVTLENNHLRVWLDAEFPRVLRYLFKESGGTLYGSIHDAPKIVEVNGVRFEEGSYPIHAEFGENAAKYDFRIFEPSGSISFDIVFQLVDNTLEMLLQNVVEEGDSLLRTLYFPQHELLTVRKSQDGASVCRVEFSRRPWNFKIAKGLIKWERVYTGSLESLQPEDAPKQTHWAMVYTDTLLGTLHNNIPVFPICMQLIGSQSKSRSMSIWNSTYHYRVKDEIMPPLLCTIALVADMNEDGRVDWMDGGIWLRNQLPDPNPLYDDAFIYKIFCASPLGASKPIPTVYTTFAQCLRIIREIHALTNGARQIVYIVGWQHEGHDSKYPDLTVVNPLLGGREKLVALIEEAKKFNAIVSLHVNFDDAYMDSPAWDPDIICTSKEGGLQEWEIFHDMQSYHISHYKDCRKSSAFKRIDELLNLLPIKRTIHLDAFRYTNESWDPDGHIDLTTELVLGCQKIIDRFAQHGVDVTTESFDTSPSFAGRITGYWHLYTIPTNKLIRFIMHRKWWGGGCSHPPEDIVFGTSVDSDFYNKTPISEICDAYYLKTLLYHYFRRREMMAVSDDGNRLVVEYGKSCVAVYERNAGKFHVTSDGISIARNDDRFIPLSDREILAYSRKGGSMEWKLPSDWSEKDHIQMFILTKTGRESFPKFQIDHGKIIFFAKPQQPYLITRGKTEGG